MLGVFKRRWKPKKGEKKEDGIKFSETDSVTESNGSDLYITDHYGVATSDPFRRGLSYRRTTGTTVITSAEEKVRLYETVKSMPPPFPPVEPPPPARQTFPTYSESKMPSSVNARNICVERGRIQFVNETTSCDASLYCGSTNGQTLQKETLEHRIDMLEKALEEERKLTQKEKLVSSRLHRQLSRRELLQQREVDREKALRLDVENKLKTCETDRQRVRARLAVLHREFIRMEDIARIAEKRKNKCEQLINEKEAEQKRVSQLQDIIEQLRMEKEALKNQLNDLLLSDNYKSRTELMGQIKELQEENLQRRLQYKKCLDDIAAQVVKALIGHKNYREEISKLAKKVEELEKCNKVLSTALNRKLRNGMASVRPTTMTVSLVTTRPLSLDECQLEERVSYCLSPWLHRPKSLNISQIPSYSSFINALNENSERLEVSESPESGNRDEGYSTMSSDIQANGDMLQTSSEIAPIRDKLTVALPSPREVGAQLPSNMSFCGIRRNRYSFPPFSRLFSSKHSSAKFGSDSQLLVIRSPSDNTILLSAAETRAALRKSDDFSLCSSDLLDCDYIAQWLKLEDRRVALQLQQDEYDVAEIQNWSMEDETVVPSLRTPCENHMRSPGSGTYSCDCSDWSNSTSATSSDACCCVPAVDTSTEFTRDFYRLVKYESSKSLASSSSKCKEREQTQSDVASTSQCDETFSQNAIDREESLKNVLKFIEEQRKYCYLRQKLDEDLLGEARTSHVCTDFGPHATSPQDNSSEKKGSFYSGTVCDVVYNYYDPKCDHTESASANTNGEASSLFRTCDNCFSNLDEEANMICGKCSESFIDCLPEDSESLEWLANPLLASQVRCLDTVIEEEQEEIVQVDENREDTTSLENKCTSREVIEELTRMIETDVENGGDRSPQSVGSERCGSHTTGWVHIEHNPNPNNPQARAGLLDVMLASSSSSSSDFDADAEEGNKDYKHLHRLHRFRRHKKVSATRPDDPTGVLRFSGHITRPSIIGREDFFVRYGREEKEAVASFDFLENISTASSSSENGSSPPTKSSQNARELSLPQWKK